MTAYIDIPFCTAYKKDSDSEYLDGSKYQYTLKLDKDYLSMTSFWSLTVYRLSGHFRGNDPVRRYLIHSPLYPNLRRDEDGGVTIYLQRESPGSEKENNWLPPPKDLFFVVMRMYMPAGEARIAEIFEPSLKKHA
jgi:hypothetical protein